jgi:hypothetical protein
MLPKSYKLVQLVAQSLHNNCTKNMKGVIVHTWYNGVYIVCTQNVRDFDEHPNPASMGCYLLGKR